MGRKKKQGFRYFPLDTDFFEDRRIRRVFSRVGPKGVLLYLYILCKAYEKNGYYVELTDEFLEDAEDATGCTGTNTRDFIRLYAAERLLDYDLLANGAVLTSHGIQAQYQEMMKSLKRDVTVRSDLWLLDKSETLGFVFVRPFENKSGIYSDKSGIYDDKSRKNVPKRKESKLNNISIKKEINKERKTVENPVDNGGEDAAHNGYTPPELIDVIRFFEDQDEAIRFFTFYTVNRNNRWPKDWKEAARRWTPIGQYMAEKEKESEETEHVQNSDGEL